VSSDSTYSKADLDSAIAEAVKGAVANSRERSDKKIAQAVAEAEQKARAAILAELDIDDPAELKAQRDKLRESEDEGSKLKREVGRLTKRAEQAEAKLAEVAAQQRASTIETAVLKAAADAVKPSAVLAMLKHQSALDVDEDGQVTADGKPITKAVSDLLTSEPYLARGDQDRGGAGSQEPTTQAPPAPDQSTPEGRKAAARAAGVDTLYPWETPGARRLGGE